MRKYFIVPIVFVLLFLAGCVKMDVGITINSDGSAENKITIGIDKNFYNMAGASGKDPMGEAKEEFETDGYTVEEYEDDKYQGIVVKKTFDNVEELLAELNKNEGEESGNSIGLNEFPLNFEVKEGFFKKTFSIDGVLDGTGGEEESEFDPFAELGADQIDFTFTLNLPVEPGETNADVVEGKTLVWNLDPTGKTEIQVTASTFNTTNIGIIFGFVVVIIVLLIIMFIRKTRADSYDYNDYDDYDYEDEDDYDYDDDEYEEEYDKYR